MLANTLVTNEIKNAAGTEKEFQRISTGDRRTEFALIGESPSEPHRLIVSHQETGAGVNRKRRSVVRFDKTNTSQQDSETLVKHSAYIVLDRPIGHDTDDTNAKEVLANLMSLCASLGVSTTILYDCSGTGASNLLSGGI